VDLGVVDLAAKVVFDGIQIDAVAVGAQLQARFRPPMACR
jgi:hypothetical protein